MRATERLIAAALLFGMDHALRSTDTSEIPPLRFEEAASFMRSRIPVQRREWDKLEPKLRFRAFSVARLAQLDYVDAARQVLSRAMESGKGVAETYKQWKTLQTLIGDNAMELRPGYWENVFRTNTQTAYTAGKLMQFQNNPPPAWRLLIVEDSRTSDICLGLLHDGKQSLTLAADHPFWAAFGYPPYHFQCRTGLQAVYQSEIEGGVEMDNPGMKNLRDRFKPMKGFGGNPLDKESWWMMPHTMAARAAYYGVFNDIELFAIENGLYNFSLNLVRGTNIERLAGANYAARRADLARPSQKEIRAAQILEDNGHRVYFTPLNTAKRMRNYDAIIDGRLGKFKRLESFKQINNRLNDADRQRAAIVSLELPIENHTVDQAAAKVRRWFNSSQRAARYVNTVLLIWGRQVITIKK